MRRPCAPSAHSTTTRLPVSLCYSPHMAPYIEVDVEAGENSPWAVVKMFQADDEPREVSQVTTLRPDGSTGPCAVTGWDGGGPTPAYAATVADSGEGWALLVYGGGEGIRLKHVDSLSPWDLEDAEQWGEPCLLLPLNAPVA